MVHLPSLGGNRNGGLGVSELAVWDFLPIWGWDPVGQGVEGHTLKWKFEDGGSSSLHSPGVDLYRVTSTQWRQACSLQSARLRLCDHAGVSQAAGAECPGVRGEPSSEPKKPPGTVAVSLASVQPLTGGLSRLLRQSFWAGSTETTEPPPPQCAAASFQLHQQEP